MAAPIVSQTASSQNGEPKLLAISAGVRKMPTPITSPTTSAVAVASPSRRASSVLPTSIASRRFVYAMIPREKVADPCQGRRLDRDRRSPWLSAQPDVDASRLPASPPVSSPMKPGFFAFQIGELVLQAGAISECSSSAGLKPNGPRPFLYATRPRSIDQVQPAGHPAVAGADRVADRVNQHRHPQARAACCTSGQP